MARITPQLLNAMLGHVKRSLSMSEAKLASVTPNTVILESSAASLKLKFERYQTAFSAFKAQEDSIGSDEYNTALSIYQRIELEYQRVQNEIQMKIASIKGGVGTSKLAPNNTLPPSTKPTIFPSTLPSAEVPPILGEVILTPTVASSTEKSEKSPPLTTPSVQDTPVDKMCVSCVSNHPSRHCSQYPNVSARRTQLEALGRCENCCSVSHQTPSCRISSFESCLTSKMRHPNVSPCNQLQPQSSEVNSNVTSGSCPTAAKPTTMLQVQPPSEHPKTERELSPQPQPLSRSTQAPKIKSPKAQTPIRSHQTPRENPPEMRVPSEGPKIKSPKAQPPRDTQDTKKVSSEVQAPLRTTGCQ